MWPSELMADEYFLAGQSAPAGLYREINTGREVQLKAGDYLPASLDGNVAAYVCVTYTWRQHKGRTFEASTSHAAT
jgi:hypothetical protein